MDHRLDGLRDKLFWRRRGGSYHCFSRRQDGVLRSLCGEHTLTRAGGQSCARPPAMLRCARCDLAEMGRRGVEESMPASPDWREVAR